MFSTLAHFAPTWGRSVDVDGWVEFWTTLVQVNDGLHGQGSGALRSIKGEVPPLTAGVLALESQGASKEDSERTVWAQLGEGAVLRHRAGSAVLRAGVQRVRARTAYADTYGHFPQVDPIVQRVPGTLLVVGFPWLLEDLADTFPLFTFEPIAARNTRRAWNAVGSWVTVSARGAWWALHAAGILTEKHKDKEDADSVTSVCACLCVC